MASTKNRPTGIVILAVLWSIEASISIIMGLYTLFVDFGSLPLLYGPHLPEWFRFGLPAEMVIFSLIVLIGFFSLYVVYGLLTAQSWSYHPALATPLFATILSLARFALYASAPSEAHLTNETAGAFVLTVISTCWLIVVWIYLTTLHVKQHLKRLPTHPHVPVLPPTEPIAKPEEKKFCRYCGAERKTDAVFCEKCGRKIG